MSCFIQLLCRLIFGLVAGILFLIALCTGLTYNEVNIIVCFYAYLRVADKDDSTAQQKTIYE
jgi:hypothetical protein